MALQPWIKIFRVAKSVKTTMATCILRIKEPELERPFKVPLATKGFIAMCIPPVSIAFLALFINGTDYFVGGMFALLTGPVAYFIFKKKYGGLTRNDPVRHPVNPRTRLGIGDTKRMAWMFGCLTAIGIIAVFFLPWYDDPQSYTDVYGIEGFFDILMNCVRWMTAAFGVLTAALMIIARRVEPEIRR